MREYEIIIDEAFKKGLSPERNIPVNSGYLWSAFGFRIGRDGIEGYDHSTNNPLSGSVDMLYSWPFPQWVSGERYNFLVIRDSVVNMEDKVYVVTDDYVVTHIFNCDQVTFGTGTLMEVADFGEYAVMVNGVVMIYWDAALGDWHEIRSSATFPMMRTVCNFKGMIVGGNVIGVWNGGTLTYDAWHDCDDKFYCWSNIGQADFTPGQDNVAGYRRDPYGGVVYHTRRLGDSVIGYSSKGVVRMDHVSDPAPTFRFTELDDVGLLNQGAMDGNLQRQVYLGKDYVLREVTSEGVKELGYYQYMDNLEGDSDIIINYDKARKDFYISNGSTTYLLSPYGLTQVPQHPSALWTDSSYDDEVVMLPNTLDDPYVPMIASDKIDMGYRGLKTIFSVEADVAFTFEPKVTIGWLNSMDEWGWGKVSSFNGEGIAVNIISGNSFLIQITFEFVIPSMTLTYMKVRYKMTDLRGIRGVYAPPLRGPS